jgi:hypothetical protein
VCKWGTVVTSYKGTAHRPFPCTTLDILWKTEILSQNTSSVSWGSNPWSPTKPRVCNDKRDQSEWRLVEFTVITVSIRVQFSVVRTDFPDSTATIQSSLVSAVAERNKCHNGVSQPSRCARGFEAAWKCKNDPMHVWPIGVLRKDWRGKFRLQFNLRRYLLY